MATDLTVALRLNTTDWEQKLKGAEERAEDFIGFMQTLSKKQVDLSDLIVPPKVLSMNFRGLEPDIQGLDELMEELQTDRRLTYLQTDVEHISFRYGTETDTRMLGLTELIEREVKPEIDAAISSMQNVLQTTIDVSVPETFNVEFSESVQRLEQALAAQTGGSTALKELSENIAALKDSTMTLVEKLRE